MTYIISDENPVSSLHFYRLYRRRVWGAGASTPSSSPILQRGLQSHHHLESKRLLAFAAPDSRLLRPDPPKWASAPRCALTHTEPGVLAFEPRSLRLLKTDRGNGICWRLFLGDVLSNRAPRPLLLPSSRQRILKYFANPQVLKIGHTSSWPRGWRTHLGPRCFLGLQYGSQSQVVVDGAQTKQISPHKGTF